MQNSRVGAGPECRDLVKTRGHLPAVQPRSTKNLVNSAERHPEGHLECQVCSARPRASGTSARQSRRVISFTIASVFHDADMVPVVVEKKKERPILGRCPCSSLRIMLVNYGDRLRSGHQHNAVVAFAVPLDVRIVDVPAVRPP